MAKPLSGGAGSQIEKVTTYLARLGLGGELDFEVELPDQDDPMYELFLAVQVTAENLLLISDERDETLRQLQEKLELISNQSAAILELSTPVTEVWDGILILPLIGLIDTTRAQQIVEDLLTAIAAKQTTAVIMGHHRCAARRYRRRQPFAAHHSRRTDARRRDHSYGSEPA